MGCGRSFVSTDKRGEDTVFPAEQLLWLVELKDGAALQDNHQVCTQDGVHAVLGGAGGAVSVVQAGLGPLRHPSCILEEEACG